MKPRLPLLITAGLVFAATAGGIYIWKTAQQRAEVFAMSVPTRPNLETWPTRFRERIQACEERLASDTTPLQALAELSRLYHANGFYSEAVQCYAGLEYLDPDDPVYPHRHAVILAGFGDAENALPRLRRVVELSPDYAPARLLQGNLLLKQNKFDEARAAFKGVLKNEPDQPHAMLGVAQCAFEEGDWEAAREILEKVVARTNYRLGYDLIVTVYEQLGLDSRALAVRGKGKASGAYRDPFDPWIDALYEDCYDVYRLSLAAGESLASGKPAEAIRRLERALKFSPDNVSLHFQLASTHLSDGALSKAREHFEKCTVLDPKFPDGWAHLSGLLERLGDGTGSRRALADGLRNNPGSPGLHLMDARRLKQSGNIDGAIEEFETSIRLRPNEADAYIELSLLLFENDRNEAGIAAMERALEAEPGHPTVLSTLALNAIMSGDESVARKWMDRTADQPRVGLDQFSSLKASFREKFGREWSRTAR